jgi:hypothetical protein
LGQPTAPLRLRQIRQMRRNASSAVHLHHSANRPPFHRSDLILPLTPDFNRGASTFLFRASVANGD